MHEIAGFRIPLKSSCRKAEIVPVNLLDQDLLDQTVVKTTLPQSVLVKLCGGLAACLLALCLASGVAVAQQGDEKKRTEAPD